MLCNSKKIGAVVISGISALVLSASAQINLQSDAINFRTNISADKSKTTTHYGKLNVYGKTTAITATSDQSNTSSQNYGIKASATNSTGAYSANTGGHFTATGASVLNYGVFATASGATQSNWAGYFAGNVYTSGTYQGSDEKLKKDVVPLQSAIPQIMQLQPKTYYFDAAAHPTMSLSTKKQFGLIAQDLETIFPDMVTDVTEPDTSSNPTKAPNTFKAVNYTQLIAVLIAGMQEQQKQIAEQQVQIVALKAKVGLR